jgi:hypothetical protein
MTMEADLRGTSIPEEVRLELISSALTIPRGFHCSVRGISWITGIAQPLLCSYVTTSAY